MPRGLKSLIVLAAGLALALLHISAGADDGGGIYRVLIEDDIINPPTAEYITEAIGVAEENEAACIIIELDTPGGLLASTRTIVKRMMNSKVPTVVFVAPNGARAGSAGVFITLAANIAAMAPSTNIGAAHPVQMGQKEPSSDRLGKIIERIFGPEEEGEEEKEKEPETPGGPMEAKILQDTTAWAKALATERGRNARWAVEAVTESASVTAEEAKRLGVIEIIADDAADLATKMDGLVVDVGGESVTLATEGVRIVDIPKGFRLKLLTVLAHPNIAYILLMLGFYGLLFEFSNPGVGFPGIAGAICLVLSFFGLQILPTSYAGVALLVIAIALFIAEIKITSYGFLTLGGIISFLIGSLILFKSPHDFMRVSVPLVVAFTLATLAVAIFLAWIAARSQRRRAQTGEQGMVGATGEVTHWQEERGKVFVHGEIWEAHGVKDLAPGDRIEVVKTEGMSLVVKARTKSPPP